MNVRPVAMRARTDHRRDATEARLAVLAPVVGSGWAAPAREAARARLEAMGLPQRRDEYWRFTDPTSLIAVEAPAAPPEMGDDAGPFNAPALRVAFMDGRFDPDASDDLSGENIVVERLAAVEDQAEHWAQDLFGALEAEGQAPVRRPLAALATAFAPDGVLVRVTGEVSRPLHIVYRQERADGDALLHHVVRLDPGASLTLLESGTAAARLCSVMEVDVAAGAALHHVRVQGRSPERRAATHVFARVAEGASMRSFTLAWSGALSRNELVARLTGNGAVVHLAGAAVGDAAFHHDDTVFVTHDAVGCESRQVFKKVLRGAAVGVFQGKILVRPGAQKTDGYQLSQGLLLDERSQFLAKPELEIYADDVACSHGTTAGAIDETALFYLRSRGVPEADAMGLLTLAFLRQALDEVADEGLAADLEALLEGWLARR